MTIMTFLTDFSAHGRLKAGQVSSLGSVPAVSDWERPAHHHDDDDYHDDDDDDDFHGDDGDDDDDGGK